MCVLEFRNARDQPPQTALQVHSREGDSLPEDREREDFQPVQSSGMQVQGIPSGEILVTPVGRISPTVMVYTVTVGQLPEWATYRRDGSKFAPDATQWSLLAAPGQTLVISLAEHIEAIQSMVEENLPLSQITRVNIRRFRFYFVDGMRWDEAMPFLIRTALGITRNLPGTTSRATRLRIDHPNSGSFLADHSDLGATL